MKCYDVSAYLYGEGTLICTVCLDNPPIDEGELADAIAAEIEKRGAICVKRLEIDDEEEVDDE